jgi:small subunit ribosomal protein S1
VAEALENYEDERPSSINDLKPKMSLEGTVSRVELFGAFIDVGVERPGLVHISQLSAKRVNRVADVVNEGDVVKVWVVNVDPANNRFNLTMLEPVAVDWDEIRAGQVYTGKVKRLERFGAFVDIGATRDGLVHVSEITTDYIQDPKEYIKAGDEVQVKVLKVDIKKRRIELSIKALEDHLLAADEDEDLEETPTAMEMAWSQARSGQSKKSRQRQKRSRTRRDEDIFSRTLDLRED